MALFRRGNVRGARLALERGLKLWPDQPEAAKVLAAIYLGWGDAGRGLRHLKTAARLDPGDAAPWLVMGGVYLDLGEPTNADDADDEAVRLDPGVPEAWAGRVGALLDAYRDEAADVLADALRAHPDDPTLLALAARQRRHRGQREEAFAFARRCLARDPSHLDGLLQRATLHIEASRPDLALVDLERAAAANPHHLEVLSKLGSVESRLGLAGRAARTIARHRRATEQAHRMAQVRQEIARRPLDPALHARMGRVAVESGLTGLARRCFRTALEFDPAYQAAREGIANLDHPGGEALPTSSHPDLGFGLGDHSREPLGVERVVRQPVQPLALHAATPRAVDPSYREVEVDPSVATGDVADAPRPADRRRCDTLVRTPRSAFLSSPAE